MDDELQLWQGETIQLPQEEHTPLGRLHYGTDVAVCDDWAKKHK